jgi:hypothetical protein
MEMEPSGSSTSSENIKAAELYANSSRASLTLHPAQSTRYRTSRPWYRLPRLRGVAAYDRVLSSFGLGTLHQ